MITPEQIEHYAAGGQRLAQAIQGLTADDMAVASEPGKWSIHQVVIHLADAEVAFGDRVRRLLAMDEPALLAWDPDAYIAKLHYDAQSVEDAVATVELTRRQLARVLRLQPPAAFLRAGTHNERGRQTVADVLAYADKHLDHHLTFVAGKRERMGKLMW